MKALLRSSAALILVGWTTAFPVAPPSATASSMRWRERGAGAAMAAAEAREPSNLKLVVCLGSSCKLSRLGASLQFLGCWFCRTATLNSVPRYWGQALGAARLTSTPSTP